MKKFSLMLLWVSGLMFGLALTCDYQPGFVIYGLISLAGLLLGLWIWVSNKPNFFTKKLITTVILVGLFLSLPLFVMGEDSKEVLILKRDLAQERVLRLQSQLSLMQQQFIEGQKYLKEVEKELNDLNEKLKVMEPKKEEKPKPEVKKK